jgi:ribosomal protein L29
MDLQHLSADLQRRLFGVSVDELRKGIAAARNELADLRVQLNRLELEVRELREDLLRREKALEEIPVDEVIRMHPGCREALARFEIHEGEPRTLREAARQAGADLPTVVATLKNLLLVGT